MFCTKSTSSVVSAFYPFAFFLYVWYFLVCVLNLWFWHFMRMANLEQEFFCTFCNIVPWANFKPNYILSGRLYCKKNTRRNGITPHTNITFLFSSVDDKFEKKMLWFKSSEILKCYRRVTSDVLYFAWAFDFGFLIRLALSDSLVDLFV